MSVKHVSLEAMGGSSSGGQSSYRIAPLNRLAFPKGKIPKCELSGQPATVACKTPHITLYYATEEQAEKAWHGEVFVHKSAQNDARGKMLATSSAYPSCSVGQITPNVIVNQIR